MTVRVISLNDIPAQSLPGRTLRWLVTPNTLGAEKIGLAIMNCPPGETVRPLHVHHDSEEVLLVLGGQGEAWVEGETAHFKAWDAVLFPANLRHIVRNTGSEPLVTASIFSPPTQPGQYQLFDDPEGW
jgi:mannose-6-phosphate isomerase-like protein (cupin superfamily)